MQTDMTIKEKATRLCAMIGVCSLGIYLAACDNGELPAGGEGAAKVELRFHLRQPLHQSRAATPADDYVGTSLQRG